MHRSNPNIKASRLFSAKLEDFDKIIDTLVEKRVNLRRERAYQEADLIKNKLEDVWGVELIDWPQTSWRKKKIVNDNDNYNYNDNVHQTLSINVSDFDVLREAKKLLKADVGIGNDENIHLNELLSKTKARIRQSMELSEAYNRKFADAAFYFSLAGVDDDELYELLANATLSELRRYYSAPKCRPADIMVCLERLAVTGLQNHAIYNEALNMLESGKSLQHRRFMEESSSVADLRQGNFSLLSKKPLEQLYRFATRNKKAGRQIQGTASVANGDFNFKTMKLNFKNLSKPLVIDLGCGFGVSCLGLAHGDKDGICNYIGIDMSSKCINFASRISRSWGMSDHCIFVQADAFEALTFIKREYPGPVRWISSQFPTPPSLSTKTAINVDMNVDMNVDINVEVANGSVEGMEGMEGLEAGGGNRLLPSRSEDFILNKPLLRLIRSMLGRSASRGSNGQGNCYFFMQTNVEDVAVRLKTMVDEVNKEEEGREEGKEEEEGNTASNRGYHNNVSLKDIEGENFLFHLPRSALEANDCFMSQIMNYPPILQESQPIILHREEVEQVEEEIESRWAGTSSIRKLRQSRWVSIMGENARAAGEGYLPPECHVLPMYARTETQVAGESNDAQIFKLLYRIN